MVLGLVMAAPASVHANACKHSAFCLTELSHVCMLVSHDAQLGEALLLDGACRARLDPLLEGLCRGLLPAELPAALQGLLYSQSHVRAAALAALPAVPCLAAGEHRWLCFQLESSATQPHIMPDHHRKVQPALTGSLESTVHGTA